LKKDVESANEPGISTALEPVWGKIKQKSNIVIPNTQNCLHC